ncbi:MULTISPECIES: hypothetical protein [unclassified Novosphingobium]|uniref:hypothetical protein n=1 Tax=unclassified Novosphingobium TaxID=2644732 RepID=UPI00146DD064|nr:MULTISPECIES: hypothetical protein [unclassified Novosphingobium]NMN07215.1 hypothetical protein [Novosphingobium sp. SG919]NMN89197.1 hypothetical protein [Novosphingobium sp. SG916]
MTDRPSQPTATIAPVVLQNIANNRKSGRTFRKRAKSLLLLRRRHRPHDHYAGMLSSEMIGKRFIACQKHLVVAFNIK